MPTGRPPRSSLAARSILVWALTGPIFGFSDTWQLVINTGTTIVTFLMVFLIQNTQNRDAEAIQVKLDELIPQAPHRTPSSACDPLPPTEGRMPPPPADQPLPSSCATASMDQPRPCGAERTAAISSEPRTRFAIVLGGQ